MPPAPRPRCWSCWAFMSPDDHGPDGYHCEVCGDEVTAADLEASNWTYNGDYWVQKGGA